mgnify:CR=1 FL=1
MLCALVPHLKSNSFVADPVIAVWAAEPGMMLPLMFPRPPTSLSCSDSPSALIESLLSFGLMLLPALITMRMLELYSSSRS